MTGTAYVEEFASASEVARREEPSWLADIRRDAIARFELLGFPTTHNEDWHYTSVAPIVEAGFRTLRAPGGEVKAPQLAPFVFGHVEWPTLVFVNGRHSAELSTLKTLRAEATVTGLATALREHGSALEGRIGRIAAYDKHAFTALNTALMEDGAFIHIPRELVVEQPIHLLFVSDPLAAKGAAHPRNLILVDRHATATVIESYVSIGDPSYFTNAVSEIVVADGATLHHTKVQRESMRAFHVGTTQVQQARDSHYISFSFATGAALSRTNIYTTLGGEGCGATLNGLYMVDGEQHVDHQTLIEHAQPNCFSREVYRGILDGASRAVFNGRVYVHPIAQKTDGKQENNNLLLSERAHVDTKPQLEIFADDVKCTHGATVGRIDETALFYMKSRGIDAESARDLLTYAFAADVLEQIAVEGVRDDLEAMTLKRFTGSEEKV